jgi:hypothetical protein
VISVRKALIHRSELFVMIAWIVVSDAVSVLGRNWKVTLHSGNRTLCRRSSVMSRLDLGSPNKIRKDLQGVLVSG